MINEVMFLRHGRTTYNLARRLQGQIDVPLDIVGRWQVDMSATALARRLYWAKASAAAHGDLPSPAFHPVGSLRGDTAEHEYQQSPDAGRRLFIVSSDLYRAQQTAHALADMLGLPVAADPELRERSFGQWEGMTREHISRIAPEAYASWKAHTGGEQACGVESKTQVQTRGMQTVRRLLASHGHEPGKDMLLLVGHGSWIVSTISGLLGLEPDTLDGLGALRNGFWATLSVGQGADAREHWQLLEYNAGPDIAYQSDWENGPAGLQSPDAPRWKPLSGPSAQ